MTAAATAEEEEEQAAAEEVAATAAAVAAAVATRKRRLRLPQRYGGCWALAHQHTHRRLRRRRLPWRNSRCRPSRMLGGRKLHSSIFRLNGSAFCGIGGSFRGCSGVVLEVLGGTMVSVGYVLCQKQLRLS